jgi:hypothetical protein
VPIGTALLAATTAFKLVKDGCALYKEIKGVAGNVKGIIDDINSQFSGKKVTKEQAKKIEEEKARVQEIAKSDPTDVIFKIGEELGNMFDAFDKVEALFWEQERESKKLQAADVSLKKMALRRILVRQKLQAMHVEIREQMVYHSPPELGALWSQFEEMRNQIEEEQRIAREKQDREDAANRASKDKMVRDAKDKAWEAGVTLFGLFYLWWLWWALRNQVGRTGFS